MEFELESDGLWHFFPQNTKSSGFTDRLWWNLNLLCGSDLIFNNADKSENNSKE